MSQNRRKRQSRKAIRELMAEKGLTHSQALEERRAEHWQKKLPSGCIAEHAWSMVGPEVDRLFVAYLNPEKYRPKAQPSLRRYLARETAKDRDFWLSPFKAPDGEWPRCDLAMVLGADRINVLICEFLRPGLLGKRSRAYLIKLTDDANEPLKIEPDPKMPDPGSSASLEGKRL